MHGCVICKRNTGVIDKLIRDSLSVRLSRSCWSFVRAGRQIKRGDLFENAPSGCLFVSSQTLIPGR